jgi:beta-1,4-mannosyltransferase
MSVSLPRSDRNDTAALLAKLYISADRANAVKATQSSPPTLIVAMPPISGNKYQILLYQEAASHGCAVIGARALQDLQAISWPGPVLLHCHWFDGLFKGAHDDAAAQTILKEITSGIDRFCHRTGAKTLWTAHNLMPHGNAYPETYLALRRWILDRFDAVHLLDDAHGPIIEDALNRSLPKHFCVPHMSYAGSLPNTINRIAARAHYDIPTDAVVFGVFGSIQAYKNIPQLLHQLSPLAQSRPDKIFVLIGGVPKDASVVLQIQNEYGFAPWLKFMPRKIPDDEVQYLHHASDIMVLAYENLNSGAAMMAASFGLPLLMPSTVNQTILSDHGLHLFNPRDPKSLAHALGNVIQNPPERRQPLPQFLNPKQISNTFFHAITSLF